MSKNDKTESVVSKNGKDESGLVAFTADQFFEKVAQRRVQFVPLPERGGGVWLAEMTAWEREEFQESLLTGSGKKRKIVLKGSAARLIIASAIKGPAPQDVESGKTEPPDPEKAEKLFTRADYRRLNSLGAGTLETLAEVSRQLSGITDDETELDEELKNE